MFQYTLIKFFQTPNFMGTHRILEMPGAHQMQQWLWLEQLRLSWSLQAHLESDREDPHQAPVTHTATHRMLHAFWNSLTQVICGDLEFARKLFPESCPQAHWHRVCSSISSHCLCSTALPGDFQPSFFLLSNHRIPSNSNPPPNWNSSDVKRFWNSEDHRGLLNELHVLPCSGWFLVRWHKSASFAVSVSWVPSPRCSRGCVTMQAASRQLEDSYQKDGSRHLNFRICCAFLLNKPEKKRVITYEESPHRQSMTERFPVHLHFPFPSQPLVWHQYLLIFCARTHLWICVGISKTMCKFGPFQKSLRFSKKLFMQCVPWHFPAMVVEDTKLGLHSTWSHRAHCAQSPCFSSKLLSVIAFSQCTSSWTLGSWPGGVS